MGNIQVIGREAVDDQNTKIAQINDMQKAGQEAAYKMHQISYNREMARIAAKNADTEELKIKQAENAKNWEIADAAYKQVVKYATLPDGGLDMERYKSGVRNMMTSLHDNYPGAMQVLGSLSEQAPALGDTQSALNQTAITAMRGGIGGGQNTSGSNVSPDFMMSGLTFDEKGNAKPSFTSMRAKQMEAAASEAGKPLQVAQADIVTKKEGIVPEIEDMVKILNEPGAAWAAIPMGKHEGLGMPFAQERIASWLKDDWLSKMSRGNTYGKGRKIGQHLQNIQQMLFAQGGGQALTDTETIKLKGYIDPSGKDEETYINDLLKAKAMLINKSTLVTTPRDEALKNMVNYKDLIAKNEAGNSTVGQSNVKRIGDQVWERTKDGWIRAK